MLKEIIVMKKKNKIIFLKFLIDSINSIFTSPEVLFGLNKPSKQKIRPNSNFGKKDLF
jgi:hypothetical protein